MSQVAQYFAENQFCIFIEYLPAMKEILPVQIYLATFPTCITLSDRVHDDQEQSPLLTAKFYPEHIDKVLHYAGKNRDIKDFEVFLAQAQNAGHQNLLLLTGDKLKHHKDGCSQYPKTRYLESVNAVMAAKQWGGFYIGVAFNPFKYVAAEKAAQYFKLDKKIKAGADYIITQLGFDLSALKEIKQCVEHEYASQKILACVMPLTLARAQFMVKQKVAGIVITQHIIDVLQQEKNEQNKDNAYLRCAIQILICKHWGYAGVHLSACHKPDQQAKLEHYLDEYKNLNLDECIAFWQRLWQVEDDLAFQPTVEPIETPVSITKKLKYYFLDFLHDTVFSSNIAKRGGAFVFQADFKQHRLAEKILLQAEYSTKHPIVGCEMCGQCRLGETLYICPETCPKGLANGPCGGTTLDICEFGDRECIHSTKARLAKVVQQEDVLKNELIPTIPIEIRGTSSWKNWYAKNDSN